MPLQSERIIALDLNRNVGFNFTDLVPAQVITLPKQTIALRTYQQDTFFFPKKISEYLPEVGITMAQFKSSYTASDNGSTKGKAGDNSALLALGDGTGTLVMTGLAGGSVGVGDVVDKAAAFTALTTKDQFGVIIDSTAVINATGKTYKYQITFVDDSGDSRDAPQMFGTITVKGEVTIVAPDLESYTWRKANVWSYNNSALVINGHANEPLAAFDWKMDQDLAAAFINLGGVYPADKPYNHSGKVADAPLFSSDPADWTWSLVDKDGKVFTDDAKATTKLAALKAAFNVAADGTTIDGTVLKLLDKWAWGYDVVTPGDDDVQALRAPALSNFADSAVIFAPFMNEDNLELFVKVSAKMRNHGGLEWVDNAWAGAGTASVDLQAPFNVRFGAPLMPVESLNNGGDPEAASFDKSKAIKILGRTDASGAEYYLFNAIKLVSFSGESVGYTLIKPNATADFTKQAVIDSVGAKLFGAMSGVLSNTGANFFAGADELLVSFDLGDAAGVIDVEAKTGKATYVGGTVTGEQAYNIKVKVISKWNDGAAGTARYDEAAVGTISILVVPQL